MANARKCDRCGKCFDPLNVSGNMVRFKNPIFQSASEIAMNMRGHMLIDEVGPDAMIDLCPKCSDDFESFMKGYFVSGYMYDPSSIVISKTDSGYMKSFKELLIGADTDGDAESCIRNEKNKQYYDNNKGGGSK